MGRACLQLGVTLCAAIAYLGLTYVAVAASPQAECHGILHRDRGYIRFGGNPGEGEGVCVVSRSEQARVLQKCLEGAFCRVHGVAGPCRDSGECVEIRRVSRVQKY